MTNNRKTNLIASYITEGLFRKLANKEEEDFIRENDLLFHMIFMHNFRPTREEVNLGIYKINSFLPNKPLIFSKSVEVRYEEYKGAFERAFYMNISDLEERYQIKNIANTDEIKKVDLTPKNENDKLCKVVMAEKRDIFLFTQLKVEDTPNILRERGLITFFENPDFYIFNSMFKNYELGDEIYIDIEELVYFQKDGHGIHYPKNHFDSFELENLNQYSFS